VQLLKNFPAVYQTRRLIAVFTRALHWSLSWARSIQSTPSYLSKIHFNTIHPPTSWSSQCSFFLAFPPISCTHSSSPDSCYMPCPSQHSLWKRNKIWSCVKSSSWKRIEMKLNLTLPFLSLSTTCLPKGQLHAPAISVTAWKSLRYQKINRNIGHVMERHIPILLSRFVYHSAVALLTVPTGHHVPSPHQFPWIWVIKSLATGAYSPTASSPYKLQPWRWRQQVPQKLWYPPTILHGVTNRRSQSEQLPQWKPQK
jgi:hypothetical protein